MTKEGYDKIRGWFLLHPVLLNILRGLNVWLPRMVYVSYPLLLAVLAFYRDVRFLRVLLVPAVAFCLVTVLRSLWNQPRPYEKLDIQPLILREKAGRSFPSRHMASATVIAAACWYAWPPLGAVMSVIALLIAVVRPLAGIHFPKDMFAGFVLSAVIGVIGFWLI